MPYYQYDTLTPEQRLELVRQRLASGYPPHAPPHPVRDQACYLLSGTCHRHARRMASPQRRQQVLDLLFEALISRGVEIRAWAILTNHYHLLAYVPDFAVLGGAFRFVHRTAAREWNAEDGTRGRQVWYRYTDRAIRSEGHYCVTLNYIHFNPVKHRLATTPYDWPESSVHWYLQHYGREWLRDLWVRYPLRSYGEGWDDEAAT